MSCFPSEVPSSPSISSVTQPLPLMWLSHCESRNRGGARPPIALDCSRPYDVENQVSRRGGFMRLTLQLLLAMALVPAAMSSAAHAQASPPAGPVYVATYVEVVNAAIKDGSKLLVQYREAARKENGNSRAEV